MKASAYNFALPTSDNSWLLFNARTGHMMDLIGPHAHALAESLSGQNYEEEIAIDSHSLELLTAQEFVLEDCFDELAAIRGMYWEARRSAPVVVTITTTLAPNTQRGA